MISYEILSEKGSRSINEDSVGCMKGQSGFLAVLADGLGGHGQGEVASALAVEYSLRFFDSSGETEEKLLPGCVKAAQEAILAEQTAHHCKNDMKTTLTLLYTTEDHARWLHVGDSRIYWFKKDRVMKRTLDHSVPQMLVAQGEIKEQEIRFHEDRNRLLRVLGIADTIPKCQVSEPIPIDSTTSFLLCSDGFWELIEEKEMQKLLKQSDTPKEWLHSMEKVVIRNGRDKKMDNYSAIAVFNR